MARHSQNLRIMMRTMRDSLEDLYFLLVLLLLSSIIWSTFLYAIERHNPDSDFTSIPASAWFGGITKSTVGYGDMVPQSFLGRLSAIICANIGILAIALPIPEIIDRFMQNQEHHETMVCFIFWNYLL
ncbi:unnamed protein product [Oikopleura dioica]|uniref:Ion transport domain-containing protein n=1 Tax=Oikopleura dioica TaxID=34765 RepID=E4XJ50_OIKDI|nr:unnamed protein product [Oikopleura dioica]